MKCVRIFHALICSLLVVLPLAFVGCATPFRDDSHFVALANKPGSGYFLVRPDSPMRDRLHLTYAPTSDTGSPLHRGHGVDVVAFKFNQRGTLAVYPAYISQLHPDPGIVNRFRGLTVGKSHLSDVERRFGRVHTAISKSDGVLVYYSIPVYNPLEEQPGGFR